MTILKSFARGITGSSARKIYFSSDGTFYGNGLNVRDWLHVRDRCAALDIIRPVSSCVQLPARWSSRPPSSD